MDIDTNIPKEYAYDDPARITINGEMINILVTEYSEVHTDNISTANMISDSISTYVYGATPIQITLSGIVKESQDNNHMYDVLTKYKTKWRQRLTTDYTKNTKLTIMDAVMDFAILSFTVVKNVDITGYDSIAIEGIGWNYTMSEDSSDTLVPGDYVDESTTEPTTNETLNLTPTDAKKGSASDGTVNVTNNTPAVKESVITPTKIAETALTTKTDATTISTSGVSYVSSITASITGK